VVSAEVPGFAKVVISPIDLEPGRTTTQNISLVPSSAMTEMITVVGRGDIVDAASTKTATVFTGKRSEGLPVLGRTYQDLLTLAPGVVDADGDPNVGGVPAGVAGAVSSGPVVGTFGQNLSLESIAQIEIVTSGSSVEFSQAQGGFVSIVSSEPADAADPEEVEQLEAELTDSRDGRLIEPALRVLADLALDRRLSRAEGVPAVVGLLATQDARSRLGTSLVEHALATWALAEAASAYPEVPWLARATEAAAAELRAAAYEGDEWPAVRGAAVDSLTSALARLALRSAGAPSRDPEPSDLRAIDSGLRELAGGKLGRLLTRLLAGLRDGSLRPEELGACPAGRL